MSGHGSKRSAKRPCMDEGCLHGRQIQSILGIQGDIDDGIGWGQVVSL